MSGSNPDSVTQSVLRGAQAFLELLSLSLTPPAPLCQAQPHLALIFNVTGQILEDAVESYDNPALAWLDHTLLEDAAGPRGSIVVAQLRRKIVHHTEEVRVLVMALIACKSSAWGELSDERRHLQLTAVARCIIARLHALVQSYISLTQVIIREGDASRLSSSSSTTTTTTSTLHDSSSSPSLSLNSSSSPSLSGLSSSPSVSSFSSSSKSKDSSSHIWTERASKKQALWQELDALPSCKEWRLGSLNSLVILLTSDIHFDPTFTATVLSTYRSFTNPADLLEKLFERFHVPASIDPRKAQAIRFRVIATLKQWLETQFFDFDSHLLHRVEGFMVSAAVFDAALCEQLSAVMKARKAQRTNDLIAEFSCPVLDLSAAARCNDLSPLDFVMTLNDEEIARQLTLIASSAFAAIEPHELLERAWERLPQRAPNVIAIQSFLAALRMWVATFILTTSEQASRGRALLKVVQIARHLFRANNLLSLSAVLEALRLPAIQRLRKTFESLDAGCRESVEHFEKILSNKDNYKLYKTHLQEISPPLLPHFAELLDELTRIDQASLPLIKTQINFQKARDIYQVLHRIKDLQRWKYDYIAVKPIHSFLYCLPYLGEEELDSLSHQLEPPKKT